MKLQYFGDSYDIVKKSLIEWLSEFGPWVTHPMFTEPFAKRNAAAFSLLLKTPLLSEEVLTPQTDRTQYFAKCRKAGNLFLDPDTGVCLKRRGGKKSENFVFGADLVEWCNARPNALTLVFDQSYSRSRKKDSVIQEKLAFFDSEGISGLIYDSHATFLLLGSNPALLRDARKVLIFAGLPEWRLVGRKRIN